MTIFDHPHWPQLRPYSQISPLRGNVDLLSLPDDLRHLALSTETNCVACGSPIKCFRARLKSKRSRIAGTVEEHRLFYAATCSSEANPGCSRSRASKDHKRMVLRLLTKPFEAIPVMKIDCAAAASVVAKIDASLKFAPKQCREAMLEARALLVKERV